MPPADSLGGAGICVSFGILLAPIDVTDEVSDPLVSASSSASSASLATEVGVFVLASWLWERPSSASESTS